MTWYFARAKLATSRSMQSRLGLWVPVMRTDLGLMECLTGGCSHVTKMISIAALVAAMLLVGTVAEAEPAAGATNTTGATAGVELPPLGAEDLVDVVRSIVGERLADVVPPVPRSQLYVDPTGNDANDGSMKAPLRTIQAASPRRRQGRGSTSLPASIANSPAPS
jgi:hypothetical protein